MAVEIEAKMRVTDLDAVRRKLVEVQARREKRAIETNRFFDSPDSSLGRTDQGLRIRTNANPDDGAAEHVVTYKGPRQPGPFKSREEIEFSTDDPAATAAVLQKLGYDWQLSFEKRRETWTLDRCEVVLDELPHLGTFVEIEGADESAVQTVREKIGLQNEPSIREGYASMVAKYLASTGAKELKF